MRSSRAFSLFLLTPFLALAQQPPPASAAGLWLGTLHAGANDLRLQLHLKPDVSGAENCSLDSLDQHAFGIPCTVSVKGDTVTLVAPTIYSSFTGHISSNGNALSGTWNQGGAHLPLALTREPTAIGPTEASALRPRPTAKSHLNA
jgi:hypothetical protein